MPHASLDSRPVPVDFAAGCRRALQGLGSGYHHYLPGIASTWFFAEIAARAVPAPAAATAPMLFFLGAVYYAAGAARVSGRHASRSVIILGIERSSSFLSVFMLLLAALVLAVLLIGLPVVAAGKNLHLAGVGMAVWALLVGLGLLRVWPTPAIAFHYRGRIRWSPAARGSAWMGPGVGAAWRLTGAPRVIRRASLPMAGIILLLGGGWLAARLLVDMHGPPLFLLNAAFYAGVLPFLYGLIDDLTGQLRTSVGHDDPVAHES